MTTALDEVAGLACTALISPRRDAAARAATQQSLLHRVGAHLPLLVVADLCRALTESDATPREAGGVPGALQASWPAWSRYVEETAASHAAQLTRRLRLPEGAAVGLALHLLSPVLDRWAPARSPGRLQLDVAPASAAQPAPLTVAYAAELSALFELVGHEAFRLATHRERVDLDTLRLLTMVEADALAAMDAEMLGEWLRLLEQPEVHDVVNFALELLPSVLDARSKVTTQDFAVNGYNGITRDGDLVDLALTELAYDDEMFTQRYLERELFFNARERTRDQETERHLVLVDGTASMRGLRAAFARAVALNMVQQLVQARRPVEVSFFDSALHPPTTVTRNDRGSVTLLGFNTPSGRDYPRAFASILRYVEGLARRRTSRVVVTFITHARCFVPNETIADLVAVAEVRGVFLLPTEGTLPRFADLLSHSSVVDEGALGGNRDRLAAARTVLGAMPEGRSAR